MPFLDGFVKKINILDNIDRSSVCLLIAVIFAPFVGGAKTVRDPFAAPFAHFLIFLGGGFVLFNGPSGARPVNWLASQRVRSSPQTS